MSGTVREAKLDTPARRLRLKPGSQCHWRNLVRGEFHLGYRRKVGAREGEWVFRRHIEGSRYTLRVLATADDVRPADADTVLSFEQAERLVRQMIDAPERGLERITVRGAYELYCAAKKTAGQPVDDLEWRFKAHILPVLDDHVVAQLTTAQLRRWLATLADSRALLRSSEGQRNYRPEATDEEAKRARRASANRVLTMLKACLNYVYNEGKVPSDDEWAKVKPFKKTAAARVRYLDVEEARRLINACPPDFRALVIAGLQTGCRYGELIRLVVHDYNADAGKVHIRQSKSGKSRHVTLTAEGQEFFAQQVAGRSGNAFIFTRSDGEPWERAQQGARMREACDAAQITPPISFHGLRHTWASLAVMNGMPLMVVARNLGHSSTRMVESHYGHLSDSYVDEAIRNGAPKFGLTAINVTPLRHR